MFMGAMYGLVFYRTEINQEGVQNINSLFFLIIIYVSAIHMYSVTNVLNRETFNYLIFMNEIH